MSYISNRDVSRINNLVDSIDSFEVQCECAQYTDTDHAWDLLTQIRDILNEVSKSS